MKRIALCVLTLCALIATQANVPDGYYSSLQGKTGQELKDAVHNMTKNHTVLSYNSLWNYYPETDCYPNSNQVWDMYSNIEYFFGSPGSAVSGMNKEHSFPKSWWGGTKNNAYSDLHHLIPTDANANSARSNWPFGEVSSTNWDNGLSKRGTPKSGQGGGATNVFEPDDQYKGDFARIYFYMVSCYQDLNWKTTYMLTNSDWKSLNQWSIDLLLRWAREDPVSQKEIDRNNAIERYQNNRNPFVDNPDLMEYIWGNKTNTPYGSDNPDPDPDPDPTIDVATLISPTQGTILEFGEVGVGDSATLTLYVRGMKFSSSVTLKCYLNQWTMFTLSTTSIDTASINSAEGYPLKVTYKPTSLGQHKAKILISGGGMTGSVGVQLHGVGIERNVTPGDINGDNNVDIADVNALINVILGKTTEDDYDFDVLDVDSSGILDIGDVNRLINLLLSN